MKAKEQELASWNVDHQLEALADLSKQEEDKKKKDLRKATFDAKIKNLEARRSHYQKTVSKMGKKLGVRLTRFKPRETMPPPPSQAKPKPKAKAKPKPKAKKKAPKKKTSSDSKAPPAEPKEQEKAEKEDEERRPWAMTDPFQTL
eukprot:jgi/Undpi1/5404/HiC_scaffold_2.g00685.m1